MDNAFNIFDLPEDAELTLSFVGHGVWFVKMTKGSPFRQLLETQQIWHDMEEAKKKGAATKTTPSGTTKFTDGGKC